MAQLVVVVVVVVLGARWPCGKHASRTVQQQEEEEEEEEGVFRLVMVGWLLCLAYCASLEGGRVVKPDSAWSNTRAISLPPLLPALALGVIHADAVQ
jgi:hypothetical protein